MKVSVCVASYNGAKFISEQLASIIESLEYSGVDEFEVLVSDDGSTDNTLEVIQSVFRREIKILVGPRQGLIKNFEYLISKASGAFIFLSDQDDVWRKEKVKKCLENLYDHDLLVSDAVVVDESLNVLQESLFEVNGSGAGFYKNLFRNSYVGCCMCFKRDVLVGIGGLPFPRKLPMHDWWIGLLFNKKAKVKFLTDRLVLYRRHENNVSSTGEQSKAGLFTRLQWRINLLFNTLIRL